MAEKTKTEQAKQDDRVLVELFKDNDKYKDDVQIIVNGRACVVQRGVPVYLKPEYAEVWENSRRQDKATADLIDRETSRYAAETRARGLN